MDLAFVQSGLLERYLDSDAISPAEVAALLKRRGVLDGTPVFLDEETQMPVPPLCEYGRYLSTALLDEATLKDYGRAVGRLDDHLASLGSDVMSAVESDLVVRMVRVRLRSRRVQYGDSHAGRYRPPLIPSPAGASQSVLPCIRNVGRAGQQTPTVARRCNERCRKPSLIRVA